MKRKTPYRTGMGMTARMGVMKVERPMARAISTAVTRCSRMPRNWGFSPAKV